MEGKVALYDSNNIKIGETFTRRARQLVKQQRASWVDDSQSAVKFAPGMEHMEDTDMEHTDSPLAAGTPGFTAGTPGYTLDPHADRKLMKLAKRRVYARFAFKLHAAIFVILCVFWVLIYMLTDPGGYFWPIWPIMGLGLSVAVHGAVYKIISGNNMTDKIAREYEELKHAQLWAGGEGRRG